MHRCGQCSVDNCHVITATCWCWAETVKPFACYAQQNLENSAGSGIPFCKCITIEGFLIHLWQIRYSIKADDKLFKNVSNYRYSGPQQIQSEEWKRRLTSRNVICHHSVQKVWCPEPYRGQDTAKVKILFLILLSSGNWYLALNEE